MTSATTCCASRHEPGHIPRYRARPAPCELPRGRVAVWAWCLMPNHVHLILVPSDADGLRRALAPVHRRYAGIIHARRRRTGPFWQGRVGAGALAHPHLLSALPPPSPPPLPPPPFF